MKYYITADLSQNDYKDTAVFTSDGEQSWVDNDCLSDWYVDSLLVATGEPNLIKLDGSYGYYPTYPSSTALGWWSAEQSDMAGMFEHPVVIYIDLKEFERFDCIQIDFGDTLPKSFDVYYNMQTRYKITDISKTTIINVGNTPYIDIMLVFNEMQQPYTYLKINEISLGRLLVFDENNSNDVKIHRQCDFLADSLPISDFSFNAMNEDNQFYSLNPNGLYQYFSENQVVKTYTSENDGNWITRTPQGTFYLTEWEDSNAEMANFKGECVIGLLDDINYNNTLYYVSGVSEPTWKECFEDIFSVAGITDYYISFSDMNNTMTGFIPLGNVRDCLRDLCIFTMTTLRIEKTGRITVYQPSFTATPTELDYFFETEKVTTLQPSKDTAVVNDIIKTETVYVLAYNKAVSNQWTHFILYPENADEDDSEDKGVYITTDLYYMVGGIMGEDYTNSDYFKNVVFRTNKVEFDFKYTTTATVTLYCQCYEYIPSQQTKYILSNSTGSTEKAGTAIATNVLDNIKPFMYHVSVWQAKASQIVSYWQNYLNNQAKNEAEITTDYDLDLNQRVQFSTSVDGVDFIGKINEIDLDISGGMIADIKMVGKAVT